MWALFVFLVTFARKKLLWWVSIERSSYTLIEFYSFIFYEDSFMYETFNEIRKLSFQFFSVSLSLVAAWINWNRKKEPTENQCEAYENINGHCRINFFLFAFESDDVVERKALYNKVALNWLKEIQSRNNTKNSIFLRGIHRQWLLIKLKMIEAFWKLFRNSSKIYFDLFIFYKFKRKSNTSIWLIFFFFHWVFCLAARMRNLIDELLPLLK